MPNSFAESRFLKPDLEKSPLKRREAFGSKEDYSEQQKIIDLLITKHGPIFDLALSDARQLCSSLFADTDLCRSLTLKMTMMMLMMRMMMMRRRRRWSRCWV